MSCLSASSLSFHLGMSLGKDGGTASDDDEANVDKLCWHLRCVGSFGHSGILVNRPEDGHNQLGRLYVVASSLAFSAVSSCDGAMDQYESTKRSQKILGQCIHQ